MSCIKTLEGVYHSPVSLYLGSISALHVFSKFVLSGEGPYLHLYDISSGKQLNTAHILGTATIHGIKDFKGVFVSFGQKTFRLFCLEDTTIKLLCTALDVDDWIWDVQLLEDVNENIALALGHNTVEVRNWKTGAKVQKVSCEENCILYCAHLIGRSWHDLILASGVVFNQVVLWKPSGTINTEGRVKPFQRFKGHQGVIFNISYHETKKKLCSVSDDRSIRIWDLTYVCAIENSTPVLILYGHSARVWDAQLLDDVIISIGEDACCIVWNYEGKKLETFKGHKGQDIWSLAVSQELRIAVTGGGDSSIRKWSLDGINKKDTHSVLNVLPPGVVPSLVDVCNDGEVLILSLDGSLMGVSPSLKCRLIMHSVNYKSYCVMAVSNQLVAVGGLTGYITVTNLGSTDCSHEIRAYQSKVLCLVWASDQDLFSTGPDGEIVWWKVQNIDSITVSLFHKFVLPYSKQRWMSDVALLPDHKGFVCGDRRGSVLLYQIDGQSNQEVIKHSSILPSIHSKMGTTSVSFHNGIFYTTGRDGTFKKHKINNGGLELIDKQKVDKGFDWVERLYFTDDGDIIVLGFHSADFLILNVSKNETLMRVSCGGGHRSWGLAWVEGHMMFTYIKNKQVMVCKSAYKKRQTIIKPHIHGKEITCVTFLGLITQEDGGECAICATGSEDTTVNIIAVTYSLNRSCSIQVLHRLQGHISSVRALGCSQVTSDHDNNQCVLLFSAGGRLSLNCWKIEFPKTCTNEPSVNVEHQSFHGTIDNQERRRKLRKMKTTELETRFMTLEVMQCSDQVFIFVGGSDGLLRLFKFEESNKKLIEMSRNTWHQCCLLSVHASSLTFPQSFMLCSAGTDGKIALWDIKQTYLVQEDMENTDQVWCLSNTLNANQSGINSIALLKLQDNKLLLASGGDDNAICVFLLEVSQGSQFSVCSKFHLPSAHAVQITGLHFVSSSRLVSVSVDQRMNLWTIELNSALTVIEKVVLCKSKFVYVPDVASMDTWKDRHGHRYYIITGQGLQVISLDQLK